MKEVKETITVNVPLDRFKELEAFEELLKDVWKLERLVIHVDRNDKWHIFNASEQDKKRRLEQYERDWSSILDRFKLIEEIKGHEKTIKELTDKLNKKPWYKRIFI